MGYLRCLECTNCHAQYSADQLHGLCAKCGKVLFARYDLERARAAMRKDVLSARDATMWRYREVMPVENPANIMTLGEGMTPLLPLPNVARRLGLRHLSSRRKG